MDRVDTGALWSPEGWFARDWLMNHRGLTRATLLRYHLGYDAEKKAVTIPYFDARGVCRQIRYRSLSDGVPKYLSPKGERQHVYNVVDSRESVVYITEGEIDCLTLKQLGFHAVGIPGANAFDDSWRYLFAYCDEVNIIYDGDEAGRKGGQRLVSLIGPLVPRIGFIRLPEGEDVNSLYKKDPDRLMELIR